MDKRESSETKKELDKLGAAIVKSLRTLVLYILPSTILAIVISPELRSYIEENPQTASYAPLINTLLITIVEMIRNKDTN